VDQAVLTQPFGPCEDEATEFRVDVGGAHRLRSGQVPPRPGLCQPHEMLQVKRAL
jgi:hypothetical protein